MKINTRSITLAATLTALCAVSGLLPYVFFLPVVVAATTLSVGMTAFVGLAFGCISLAYSFVMPMSLVSMAFIQAPYIAIIPRILAALGAFGMFRLLVRLCKPKSRGARFAVASAASAVGSLLNTALVVTMLVLIMPSMESEGITMIAYVPTMLISGAIECVCMALLVPPISMTLERVVIKRKKADGVNAEVVPNGGPIDTVDPAAHAGRQAEAAEDNATEAAEPDNGNAATDTNAGQKI